MPDPSVKKPETADSRHRTSDLVDRLAEVTFPARGAVVALRDQIEAYLRSSELEAGSSFPTDLELVQGTGLSRSTVRRAVGALQADGWVRREAGRGSFLTRRAATATPDLPMRRTPTSTPTEATSQGVIRVAVLIFNLSDLEGDWFSPSVLQGVVAEAAEEKEATVQVELVGQRHDERDPDVLLRRLRGSKPDVLICLAPDTHMPAFAATMQRFGVPVVAAGTRLIDAGVPLVVEDNRQGMALAVRHLVEAGHRRIGLGIVDMMARWTLDRCRSFIETTAAMELDTNSQLVHFADVPIITPPDSPKVFIQEQAVRTAAYLEKHKPTAIVCASYIMAQVLGEAIRITGHRVPEDLSIITFDQHPHLVDWLGVRPTVIELPLYAMGRRLARLAIDVHAGQHPIGVTSVTCTLREGKSVKPPTT